MKTFRKYISVVLTSSIILSSCAFLSSCKTKKAAEKITADSTWYNSKTVSADTGYDSDSMDYWYFDNKCACNGSIYTVFRGSRFFSDEELLSDDFDTFDYEIHELLEYDTDGNLLSRTDISEFIKDSGSVRGLYPENNILNIFVEEYDYTTFEESYSNIKYDTDTDSIISSDVLSFDYDKDNAYLEAAVPLSNGAVMGIVYSFNDNAPSYTFVINEDNQTVKTINPAEGTEQEIYDMLHFITKANGNLLCVGSGPNGTLLYDLDVSTYEVKELSIDGAVSTTFDFYSYQKSDDGNLYLIDEEGIKKLNTENMEITTELSFGDCNVNLYDITNYSVVSATDTGFILTGTSYDTSSNNYYQKFNICTLTKSDTNPNAGKLRLTVGIIDGYVSESIAEAIYTFNETDEGFFASVKKYDSYANFEYSENMSDEEYRKAILSAQSSMTNNLAIELMSGEGPDIIMNAASFSQLNSENYLKDLTEFVNGLDPNAYFMNVINAAKTGDFIYQLPLNFVTTGIACETEYAPSNGRGFTLDEYKDFVQNVCNGKDPFTASRSDYFINGISEMSDLFIDQANKKVSFSQQTFYDYAAYCLDNVPEEVINNDNIIVYETYGGYGTDEYTYSEASREYLYNISSYADLSDNGQKDIGLYGVSADGRGPSIEITSSVAISATTAAEEGTLRFLNILISENIQRLSSSNHSNCINRNALTEASNDIIATRNAAYDSEIANGISEAELHSWGMVRLDESLIDRYFEALGAADTVSAIDPSVASIILEEIPAYFTGQKSIEDVAFIIDNRAQTILDER